MMSKVAGMVVATLIVLSGDDTPEELQYGKKLLDSFKTKEAVQFFTDVIANSPDNSMAYYYRGLAYADLSKPKEAIADFDRAIKIDNKSGKAFMERGRMYLAQRDWKQANEDLTKAVKLMPKDPMPYHWRGVVNYESGAYRNALEDFDQGHKCDPDFIGLYHDLVWVLATCPDKDIRDGKRALELASDASKLLEGGQSHTGLELIAVAYAEMGRFKDAVASQEKAIEILASKKRDPQKKRAEVRLKAYEKCEPLRYSSWTSWY